MSYAVPTAGGRHRTDRDPVVAEAAPTVAEDARPRGMGKLKNALHRLGQGLGASEPVEEILAELPQLTVVDDAETLPERLPTRETPELDDDHIDDLDHVDEVAEVDHVDHVDNVVALNARPCFDVTAVLHLAGEVDDRLYPWRFAGRYREQLDHRVSRIQSALERDDVETAMDAVLSLKVSSALVGTWELVDVASTLELEVRAGDLQAARSIAAQLPAVAARATDAISPYLSA